MSVQESRKCCLSRILNTFCGQHSIGIYHNDENRRYVWFPNYILYHRSLILSSILVYVQGLIWLYISLMVLNTNSNGSGSGNNSQTNSSNTSLHLCGIYCSQSWMYYVLCFSNFIMGAMNLLNTWLEYSQYTIYWPPEMNAAPGAKTIFHDLSYLFYHYSYHHWHGSVESPAYLLSEVNIFKQGRIIFYNYLFLLILFGATMPIFFPWRYAVVNNSTYIFCIIITSERYWRSKLERKKPIDVNSDTLV